MAISGQQVIAVGLQNESANSDSLYTAFNKTVTNFATLFACASPYNTFTGNTGITVNTNANTNTIDITNSGVVSLTAGDSSINLTGSNGNITITATGGGNGGGVSSIGVSSSTLTVTNTPIISAGNIVVNLPVTGITAATYTNPTVTVDTFGRVTNIANNTVSGTVTSVGITPGSGILVTNSPITSTGNITVTNTGVTRISAGTGISVSGSNGNVTISTTASGGTVTGVTIASNNLTVTGGTITTSGTISIDLPSNINISTTGNITGGNIDIPNGRANVTGTASTVGGGATVGVRSILAIDSAFGSNSSADPASAQAIRGRVTGSNLTKTRNYVAGVTGQYLVTGTNASEFINTGLLGVVGDQTTTANAAVVAYLDGDGGLTTAGSAYGVSMKNSTPGSGFDYGLDLQFIDLNVVGTTTPFKQADIRFNNGVELVANVANTISIGANLTVTGNITGSTITSTGIVLLNSSEDLADAAAANLLVTASYFTTIAAETATLAAGTAGQIKTFMMAGDGGDMVITVTNPAWGGAGTMTFNTAGQGCTLQYINSKWFCIGNNGVTFA
jgi:hypothetical protein